MTRSYRRRRPVPCDIRVDAILPFTQVDMEDRGQLALYRLGRPPTLVCTAEGPPRALLGLSALVQARRLHTEVVAAWQIDCADSEAEQIAAADRRDASLPQIAQAIALLRAKGLPSVAIAAALGLRPWDISRLAAANSTGERLSSALAKGLLPFSHARLLSPLPGPMQASWTERAIAGRWSYRKLERELQEAAKPVDAANAPDLGAFASQLAEQLGTQVDLEWPDDPAKRRLTLSWYGPEDLKGLMAKLAAGPEATSSKPIRRELVLQLATTDELDALTGHLLQL